MKRMFLPLKSIFITIGIVLLINLLVVPVPVNANGTGLSVTGITPDAGDVGSTVSIADLKGTGFQVGATVMLTHSGNLVLDASNVIVTPPSSITCDFTIPSNVPLGPYNVVVTNPDGTCAQMADGFTIKKSSPSFNAIDPSGGARGKTIPVTITGAKFLSGKTVTFRKAGSASIPLTSITSSPSTSTITGSLSIPADAAPGSWDIVITNPDGQSVTAPKKFRIMNPPPSFSDIKPSRGEQGKTVPVTITGSRFMSGSTVTFRKAGSAPFTLGEMNVSPSTSTITGSISIPQDMVPGGLDILIANPDGQSVNLPSKFRVTYPQPSFTAVNPFSGEQGTIVPLTISGANFMSGTTVIFGDGTIHFTNTGVTPSTITGSVSIPADSVPGTMNIEIINPDDQYAIAQGAFTVSGFSAEKITPDHGVRGKFIQITDISGNGFAEPLAVKLTRNGSADIIGYEVRVISPAKITCRFNIPWNAKPGMYEVIVTNYPSGGSWQLTRLNGGFQVRDPEPTISRITPDAVSTCNFTQSTRTLLVKGTGFTQGATVILTNDQESIADYPTITEVASTSIRSLVEVGKLKSGSYDVKVLNGDGQSVVLKRGFRVSNCL
jgi:hypothetical protein